MKASFKALSFDAAGTLFKLVEPVGTTYSRVALEFGVTLPADVLEKGFRMAWVNNSGGLKVGIGEEKLFWRKLVDETFARASADHSSSRAEVSDEMFETLFAHFAEGSSWRLFPETERVLEFYAGSFPLVVVSNFDQRLRGVLNDLDINHHFEAVIISDEVGFRKPHGKPFLIALEKLQLAPAELLHVGDDPVCDWKGAEAAGCQSFQLKRPDNNLDDLPPH